MSSDDPRLETMDFVVNQYVIVDGQACRFDGTSLVPTKWTKIKGFSPKNLEQRCLFDLLDNDDIRIKVVSGVAGSGKTKAALTYGLHKVEKGVYDRLLIVRQPAPAGEPIGLLPGDLPTKLAPWQAAAIDALSKETFDYMLRSGHIEFDVLQHMQGRDLRRTFIVVDEAQNLTVKEAKMLGTRCAEGSVIAFIGDVEQAVNKKYEKDNGLTRIVEVMTGHSLFGYVRLTQSVRSDVAELFALRM